MNKLISFKSSHENNKFEVVLDESKQTFWATELQIAALFDKNRTLINKHIKNIFAEGELNEFSTSAKIALVRKEGERSVEREVAHYNLDVIISVGYRVKSKIATEFRIWATNIIKEHLLKGYSINEKRLEQLQKTIQLIQRTSKITNETEGLLAILADYSAALDILDRFDHQSLTKNNVNNVVSYKIEYKEAKSAIEKLKIKFGGSNLFGNEKDQSFKSSIATIDQTFDGKELYPSIEEKAANLLYFVVKNHSFSDGNKRIAAWLFVWYLDKNNYLYKIDQTKRIENNTLVALTLLIAESNPSEKEMMINVIINLIN
ncbi:MAG: virulence RhuM family protein [Polaribacter sp.]|nr:virulence RhuM family protein [Polaribacter sp.]